MRTRGIHAALLVAIALSLIPAGAARGARSPRAAAFTVIAVVDSGIDPYHLDFRRPELRAHPSTYIEGFPRGAPALRLPFDKKTWSESRSADRHIWSSVKRNKLYWVPGTNIVGAIGPFDVDAPLGVGDEAAFGASESHPFLDEVGHGTAVASLAGGSLHGPSTDRTLIVAVKGFEKGLTWAARQPWIDVITNSWWSLELDDYSEAARVSRAAVESGKIVCHSSGNYSHPQLYTATQGPSWTINVGAASAKSRGEHYYTNYPNDVLGLAGVGAAVAGSFDEEMEFAGTSAATPGVCGLIAKTLSEVRETLGDRRQGARPEALATGPPSKGMLRDGKLTRGELEDAVMSTAVPAEASTDTSDPYSVPALPVAPFLRGGYGIVDEDSAAAALDVILGQVPRPDRTVEDTWIAAVDTVRDAIWTTLP